MYIAMSLGSTSQGYNLKCVPVSHDHENNLVLHMSVPYTFIFAMGKKTLEIVQIKTITWFLHHLSKVSFPQAIIL